MKFTDHLKTNQAKIEALKQAVTDLAHTVSNQNHVIANLISTNKKFTDMMKGNNKILQTLNRHGEEQDKRINRQNERINRMEEKMAWVLLNTPFDVPSPYSVRQNHPSWVNEPPTCQCSADARRLNGKCSLCGLKVER